MILSNEYKLHVTKGFKQVRLSFLRESKRICPDVIMDRILSCPDFAVVCQTQHQHLIIMSASSRFKSWRQSSHPFRREEVSAHQMTTSLFLTSRRKTTSTCQRVTGVSCGFVQNVRPCGTANTEELLLRLVRTSSNPVLELQSKCQSCNVWLVLFCLSLTDRKQTPF